MVPLSTRDAGGRYLMKCPECGSLDVVKVKDLSPTTQRPYASTPDWYVCKSCHMAFRPIPLSLRAEGI